MSVASPVLERKIDTKEESDYRKEIGAESVMSAEEKHNSQISSNYAKLINPEYSLKDIIKREAEPVQTKEPLFMTVHREVRNEKPYLVENARATADIFRADSAINRKAETKITVAEVAEEENEDLMPTKTTIQYRTEGVKHDAEEGKIENISSKKKISKKEKLIIAAVVSVIIALFVLIIINSAIISGVSNDLSSLETSLDTAKQTYTQVVAEKQQYLESLQETVYEFATANGMIAD
ncbi:MAG: hypothetical protein K2O41_03290 [Clostridia bacterium]|nr:hypothetical protein [Clostridia bacterium]